MARTIVKTLVYLTTICVVHIANKYLLSAGDFALPLDTLIVAFIALTEVKSILENLHKIQKQPLLQFLIDRLASDSSLALEQIKSKEGQQEPKPEPEPEEEPCVEPKKKRKKKEKKGGTSKRQK